MARYYNKSAGSLAVTLRSGTSASLAGKSWTDIPASEEGSEDLIRAIKKGFVYRFDDSEPAPAPAAVEAAPPVGAAEPASLPYGLKQLGGDSESSQPAQPVEASALPASEDTAGDKTPETSRRRKV